MPGSGRRAWRRAVRKILRLFGLLLVATGISGTVDHLAAQPFMGVVLNAFNRWVVPRVDFLAGYEVFANLALAAAGVVVVVAAGQVTRD